MNGWPIENCNETNECTDGESDTNKQQNKSIDFEESLIFPSVSPVGLHVSAWQFTSDKETGLKCPLNLVCLSRENLATTLRLFLNREK